MVWLWEKGSGVIRKRFETTLPCMRRFKL